jgi:ankyrin repeat protein
MIEKGADVNARNNEGATPLQIALRNKRTITTQVLLESGADAADRHGKRKD